MVEPGPGSDTRKPETARLVGRSLPRPEDPLLLRGAAKFIADFEHPLLENAAHVVFVRSTMGHARLLGVKVDAARNADGVVAVITADDHDVIPSGSILPAFYGPRFTSPVLAEKKVRYVGEPIAAVVAETVAQALDAAELVEVDYDPLDAVTDLEDALSDRVVLFSDDDAARHRGDNNDGRRGAANPPVPTNIVLRHDVSHDPLRFEADVTVAQRFFNPRQSPAPIETHGQACAWTADGHLHVWAATQRPHGFREHLCNLFQMPSDHVHVTAPRFVGGGFGGKVSRTPEESALAVVAKLVGRPVRWAQRRSSYLQGATQGRGELMDIRLAGSRDGRIQALHSMMIKDAGAYPAVGANLPGRFNAPGASGPYDIAHVEFNAVSVVTNMPQVSALRGAGRGAYLAALERLVDMYAAQIGMDPVQVRRRNLVQPEQMPFASSGGATYDEADYPAALASALEMAGYSELRADQAERRKNPDDPQLGIGVATYHLMTVGSGGEEARVVIRPDGGATVYTGTTSQGHGHDATWAQIAADDLGMRFDQITVLEGSTAYTDTGVGAVGSRSLQTAGLAIHNSSRNLVDQARELAATLLEASVEDITLQPADETASSQISKSVAAFHVVGVPSRSLGWHELAQHLQRSEDELTCGEIYDIGDNSAFPSGTHIAVVEIDPHTGQVELLRFVGVDDVGVRVNPMIVEGQLHGGIALGIAQVLGERMEYDADANPLTSTFVDYQMLTADMVPQFELSASETATSFNELGVKGVGESGPVGSVAAVHNAVVDALQAFGVRHLDLPCTPERIWQAIQH